MLTYVYIYIPSKPKVQFQPRKLPCNLKPGNPLKEQNVPEEHPTNSAVGDLFEMVTLPKTNVSPEN